MMVLSLALLALPACDEGDDGDELAEESEESGDTDTDTDTDADTTAETDTAETDTDGKDTDDGEDTGELMGCAAIASEDACVNEAGCAPVLGNPLVDDGSGGLCIMAAEEFVGCASTNELCPGTGKTLCGDGDSLWRTTGCVPGNVNTCEAPLEITGACA